jgi:hypothetical protein
MVVLPREPCCQAHSRLYLFHREPEPKGPLWSALNSVAVVFGMRSMRRCKCSRGRS